MGLTKCEKFGYGTGHAFNDLCSTLWFTYSLLFYKTVLGFSGFVAGAIMFIGQAADAAATPVIGLITDRTSVFERWGKKKSWHLVGTLGVLFSLPFMYSPPLFASRPGVMFVYYCFFVVIFQFSWSVVQVVHLAIVTVLSNDHIERTQLFSIRNSFTFLASIFTYLISWAVLCQDEEERLTPEHALKFLAIVMIICIIGFLMSLFYYLTVKEVGRRTEMENVLLTEQTRLSMKQVFSKLIFYQAALIYTSARVFCSVSQSFLNLYLHGELKLKKECTATIPLLINVVSFLASWSTTNMNQVMGRKLTFGCGCAMGVVAAVWIWFGEGETYNKIWIYVVAVILGVAYPLQLVTSLAVTADAIGSDVGNSAFIYGVMSFFEKLTNGIVIFVIECLAPSDEKPLESTKFYRDAIVYSCTVSMALGFSVIMTINKNYKYY